MSFADDDLPDALERARQEERRRALRALLASPLLTSARAELALVRRHAPWLREWLSRETGWTLVLETDFARLRKGPADLEDPTRGARAETGSTPGFRRRRYALLCLLLAELERGEGQTTLARLGESLVAASAEPSLAAAGLRFALDRRDERRDLVMVVRLLLGWGLLGRVAGDEEAFVQQGHDVLYDVNRRLLAVLLVATRGPSLVELNGPLAGTRERVAAITETLAPAAPEARNRAVRQRLTRRLLDDPVVYWEDLAPDEAAYLTSQRSAIARRIEEATGLVGEMRAEGIAMVDPQGELTDLRMPSEGTEGHATLLLAGRLVEAGSAGLAPRELEDRVRTWARRYRRYWRKGAREPGAEREIAEQAVERLEALRLVRREGDRVVPRPALARFRLLHPERAAENRSLEIDV